MSDDKCANTAPVVLVHGGAGDIPDVRVPLKLAGVKRAAAAGHRVIVNGGSVLDAVETAVRIMEDDEAFNAGTLDLCKIYFQYLLFSSWLLMNIPEFDQISTRAHFQE